MIKQIPLDQIQQNPWQTRGQAPSEYIQELAEDIRINGLLQSPAGRETQDGIQLAFGHNRLAAFVYLAGMEPGGGINSPWASMPVDILKLTDEQMAMLAWSENERRRDLTPLERALAIQKRMAYFAWTQEQAAERLQLSRTTVTNILRLLDLPENIQEALGSGELSERSAMALLPIYDVPEPIRKQQIYSWNGPERIVEEALDGASSEAIRKQVNDYFARSFTSLHEGEVKIDKVYPEGEAVYCGTCKTCDRRMASRNLCMDHTCYQAKVQLTRHEYLAKASLASGYNIVDEQKGGYPSTLPDTPERLEKILATKCPNLRLAYDLSGNGRDDPRRIDGHKRAILVCDKRNDSCTCRKAMEKIEREEYLVEHGYKTVAPVILDGFVPEDLKGVMGETPEYERAAIYDPSDHGAALAGPPPGTGGSPTPAQLEQVMRDARKAKRDAIEKFREVQEMVVDLLAEQLAEQHPGAMYVLVERYTFPRGEIDLQAVYREGAHNIAQHFMPGDYENVNDLVEKVNQALDRVDLPAISLQKTLAEVFEEQEA